MSVVVKTLIDDICRIMIAGEKSRANIYTAVRQCEAKGKFDRGELLQLTEAGIPVVAILSRILRTTQQDVSRMAAAGEISYQDLICAMAIFAQDLMQRSQERRY